MIPFIFKAEKAEYGFPKYRTPNQDLVIARALKFLSLDPFSLKYELKKSGDIEFVFTTFKSNDDYDFSIAYRVENDRLLVERIGTNLFDK